MSVDPGLIRSEPHPGIGFLLQRDASILVDRWARRAVKEQPDAKRMHHEAIVDHLPALLKAIGRSLAESGDTATTQHCGPATVHGEQRWQEGWSLTEVVRDYQILRLVILDYFEEVEDVALNHRSVMAIGLALDEAIAASVGMYVAHRDLHAQAMEKERAERDSQIQEYLRQKAEILQDVDRRKSEFLATLGHEMRNPLAPLSHSARLLERRAPSDPEAIEVYDIISRQVQQLTRLADDLLDMSRIAQGKIELRPEPVDICAIVERAVQTSMPNLRARNQELELELPSPALLINGDSARLGQVIVNLLNNAAKYTERGGRVWLSLSRDGDEAVIRVRDNGIGIAPELLPHVFELFTQGNWPADRAQGGMGIGLALVRRLVGLHRGTINAISAGLGKGSEFVVRMPALAPHLHKIDQPSAADSIPPSSSVKPIHRTVLVVDDNIDTARSLSLLLGLEGHSVRVAHDGPTTLREAADFQPEVILLDIGLPHMDGYDVARQLHSMAAMHKTLLIALTGYGQAEDRQRSMQAGFDAHLVKPVDLDALKRLMMRPIAEA